MAAGRDQAARVLSPEPQAQETAQNSMAPKSADDRVASRPAVVPASEPRQETISDRKPGGLPNAPAEAPAAGTAAKPKSNPRKFVLMGIGALLAVAVASYGAYYMLVGRFIITTDDAYVRANNTTIGARVAGHVAAIVPKDIPRHC